MIPQGCNQGKTQSSCVRQLRTQQNSTKLYQGQTAPEIKVSQQLRMTMRQPRMETWRPNSVPTVASPAHGEQSGTDVSRSWEHHTGLRQRGASTAVAQLGQDKGQVAQLNRTAKQGRTDLASHGSCCTDLSAQLSDLRSHSCPKI